MQTPPAKPVLHGILSRLPLAGIVIFTFLMAAAGVAGGAEQPALTLQKIADGVHVLRAPSFEVTPANAGFVSNIGVIEDERGLVVLGTGTSRLFAQHLLAFLERTLGKPVIAAINLYGGGDHVLGNGVFVARGVPVTAHAETERFVKASCHTCVERLTAALGQNAMAGTEPTPPGHVITGSGPLAGVARPIKLLHFGHTFQPGAVAVLDETTGTLFAGELGSAHYLPDLYNASETGWRDALTQMEALGARHVVPSHGVPGGREVLEAPRRYLDALIGQVDELFGRGASLQESLDQVGVSEFGDWYGYAIWHRRNVHFAYLHREQREFGPVAGH